MGHSEVLGEAMQELHGYNPVTEEEEHWPTERMINEEGGNPDYALPDDLEGLDNATLQQIAEICLVSTYAPGECIPCLAGVILAERLQSEKEGSPGPGEESIPFEETPEWKPPGGDARHADPAKEFARQVGYLQQLVDEILNGPPIPPREVSETELALLVVAAQRWIAITEAQGNELSTSSQAVLDATRDLVSRLQNG